jgi:hypothetical protein
VEFLAAASGSNAPPQAPLTTDEVFSLAESAIAFTKSAYWDRMTQMLQNWEKVETDVLLNPTQEEAHALARASITVCRKVMAMPFVDIEQGKAAMKAVEAHGARFRNLKAR